MFAEKKGHLFSLLARYGCYSFFVEVWDGFGLFAEDYSEDIFRKRILYP